MQRTPQKEKKGSFPCLQEAYKALDQPGQSYKTIHVTGTNGKGSVSVNIARGLEKNGAKVGLFISPHVHCVSERISVQGATIPLSEMQRLFDRHKKILSSFAFFDLLTLLALLYFKEQKVDYAVIEVGIGGYLDSTNVISSDLAVITGVHIDHTDMLGNTRASIATHKARIIKGAIPAVLGFHSNLKEVQNQIAKVGATPYVLPPFEDYEQENKAIADKALEVLGMKIFDEQHTLSGRFERRGKYVFDMAHNVNAFLSLQKKMEREFVGKKVLAIWNIAKNKEVEKCLEILRSFVEEVYFYPLENERLITASDAKKLGVPLYQGEEAEVVLVCGSIFLVSELLPWR